MVAYKHELFLHFPVVSHHAIGQAMEGTGTSRANVLGRQMLRCRVKPKGSTRAISIAQEEQ